MHQKKLFHVFEESKQNFATYSELSVEVKDKIYTSKVPRDIRIGQRIDTYRNAAPDTYQNVQKNRIETSPFTMSNTRKVDLSIMSF